MKIVIYIECCVFFHVSMILREIHVLIKGYKHIFILSTIQDKDHVIWETVSTLHGILLLYMGWSPNCYLDMLDKL